MGSWWDVSNWISAGDGYIGRDRLRCVVQYFVGLAWTCVIDLYAGVSTTPVEIMVEDEKPNFLALTRQDSRGRGYGYSPGGSSKTDLCFPRVSCSPVERCTVDSRTESRTF